MRILLGGAPGAAGPPPQNLANFYPAPFGPPDGVQNRLKNRSKFRRRFRLVSGPSWAPLGGPLEALLGPLWGQVLLFLALGSLLDTLHLPKRRFSGNTTKTNGF